jgi:hypothetical protein
MLVDQKKLDLYVEKNFNVLFEGERGVGKTSIIQKTFEKAGLRVKYFSAPTMDPWTDLVGVPTTVKRDDGQEVLRLIRPEEFVDDNYDVIFIDELNRAKDKVMNALMELIQFKTINGKPYNIKMIWAAINPHTEDEEYHVEPLDPAVKDRFQIQIKIPYKVDNEFFKKSYGQVGEIFCSWWNNQPEPVKKEISPRRLFDAAGFHIDGGDLADMITTGNTNKLKQDLREVSQLLVLEKDFKNQTITNSKSILNRNYSPNVEKYLKSNSEIFEFFLPHIDKEWLSKEFITKDKVYNYITDVSSSNREGRAISEEIIKEIVSINPGKNPFVKRNLAEFDKFLPTEVKEAYVQKAAEAVMSLSSGSSQEANFINLIGDKALMNKQYNLSGQDIKQFNWNNMKTLTVKGMEAVKKGSIDMERCKQQISERIGAVFALIISQKEMNDSIKKTIDSLTDSSVSNTSYIWRKNNIDSSFADMGDLITTAMTKYSGHNSDEIKQAYIEMTVSPSRKKNKTTKDGRPVKQSPTSTPAPKKAIPVTRNDDDDFGIADLDEDDRQAMWGQKQERDSYDDDHVPDIFKKIGGYFGSKKKPGGGW